MKQKNEKWEKLGPLPGLPYAQMITEVLEKHDIPHSLTQDGIATAYGFSGTNLAGNEVYLFVPPAYVERVREIIEQLIDHI